jgi:hypothetical protein
MLSIRISAQFSAMSESNLNFEMNILKLNDFSVALIQTIKSIQFGAMVMPVRLTPERVDVGNLTAVLAGFGQTRVEPRTDVKQFLEMKTLRSPDCRRHYLSFPFNAVRIFDSNICFSNPPGRGMCGGKFEIFHWFLMGFVTVSC